MAVSFVIKADNVSQEERAAFVVAQAAERGITVLSTEPTRTLPMYVRAIAPDRDSDAVIAWYCETNGGPFPMPDGACMLYTYHRGNHV